VPRIAATLAATTAAIERELGGLGLAVTSRPRGPHLLGLARPPEARRRAAASLADEGIHLSLRGNAVRIAPHLHTTAEDIGRLAAGLARCLRA
jgi:selenocysteine lyase/cysteine desulfurase